MGVFNRAEGRSWTWSAVGRFRLLARPRLGDSTVLVDAFDLLIEVVRVDRRHQGVIAACGTK